MIAERFPEIKNLTPEEKLALSCELWNEISMLPEMLPVRADHVQIIEESLAEYERNPQGTILWEELKQRLLGSR